MAEIVNLRRACKRRAAAEKDAQAAENRVRFGRTKAEKAAERNRADRLNAELDGKRLAESDESR